MSLLTDPQSVHHATDLRQHEPIRRCLGCTRWGGRRSAIRIGHAISTSTGGQDRLIAETLVTRTSASTARLRNFSEDLSGGSCFSESPTEVASVVRIGCPSPSWEGVQGQPDRALFTHQIPGRGLLQLANQVEARLCTTADMRAARRRLDKPGSAFSTGDDAPHRGYSAAFARVVPGNFTRALRGLDSFTDLAPQSV